MPKIKKRGNTAKDNQEQAFTAAANKASAFLSRYKKQFTVAASALAAVLLIMAGYSFIQGQRDRKAAPLVDAAYEQYNGSDTVKPDYAKALELFRGIQKEYPGTKNGAIAQYNVGNCLVQLGRPEDALKEYWAFTKKYPGEKMILGLVYQRMGYVYLMLGKQAEAITAFEQAERTGGPGVATYELARLYEASGNVPEAMKKYKQVSDLLPGTSWALEAMGKVQKISSASPAAAVKPGK